MDVPKSKHFIQEKCYIMCNVYDNDVAWMVFCGHRNLAKSSKVYSHLSDCIFQHVDAKLSALSKCLKYQHISKQHFYIVMHTFYFEKVRQLYEICCL